MTSVGAGRRKGHRSAGQNLAHGPRNDRSYVVVGAALHQSFQELIAQRWQRQIGQLHRCRGARRSRGRGDCRVAAGDPRVDTGQVQDPRADSYCTTLEGGKRLELGHLLIGPQPASASPEARLARLGCTRMGSPGLFG